ncbi:unnamed protein product [Linum tenue]|uniref:NAD-dependent epimerase/dehydratase domain-containing protein n=1 Tax=Linum tenue TaxID=586396 RepID=A0AAV0MW13_9ROSI|nr:unnamed protein product [Linum tenue]
MRAQTKIPPPSRQRPPFRTNGERGESYKKPPKRTPVSTSDLTFTNRIRDKHTPIMSTGAGKTVCVTGASGYIASWLVKLLLSRGYIVRASVRDPNDPRKTEHLRALDGASERLQLFKANLLEEGSFDSVVQGCDGVFHTASPFYHDVQDPQRVVLTSSIAAVAYNGKPRTPEVVLDETWFSNPDFCRETKLWYVVSKTLAEDAAWKLAKEKGMDMVTINPAMVIGPLLQPTLNTSAAAVLSIMKGRAKDNGIHALERFLSHQEMNINKMTSVYLEWNSVFDLASHI